MSKMDGSRADQRRAGFVSVIATATPPHILAVSCHLYELVLTVAMTGAVLMGQRGLVRINVGVADRV